MPRPSLPAKLVKTHPIQKAARVGFEVSHDPFRRDLRFDPGMNVSGAHVGREQTPAPMSTYLLNRGQNGIAAHFVQTVGDLIHAFSFGCGAD